MSLPAIRRSQSSSLIGRSSLLVREATYKFDEPVNVYRKDVPRLQKVMTRKMASPRSKMETDRSFLLDLLSKRDSPQRESSSQMQKQHPVNSITIRAMLLAKKHRLEFSEVRRILSELQAAYSDGTCSLDLSSFSLLLSRVFGVKTISPDLVERAFERICPQNVFNIDHFFDWYIQNMFGELAQLHGDTMLTGFNTMTRALSKLLGCDLPTVDKLQKLFDSFDSDRSGFIDYAEFEEMMYTLTKARQGDISSARLKKFWHEIDANSNGQIEFTEFASWYLRSFCNGDSYSGPAECFYQAYCPSVQRWNFLKSKQTSQQLECS